MIDLLTLKPEMALYRPITDADYTKVYVFGVHPESGLLTYSFKTGHGRRTCSTAKLADVQASWLTQKDYNKLSYQRRRDGRHKSTLPQDTPILPG